MYEWMDVCVCGAKKLSSSLSNDKQFSSKAFFRACIRASAAVPNGVTCEVVCMQEGPEKGKSRLLLTVTASCLANGEKSR